MTVLDIGVVAAQLGAELVCEASRAEVDDEDVLDDAVVVAGLEDRVLYMALDGGVLRSRALELADDLAVGQPGEVVGRCVAPGVATYPPGALTTRLEALQEVDLVGLQNFTRESLGGLQGREV